ncbi:MAG: hypothetical protein C0468_06745 [Planctomyces sp.]|nr:hypothetical protein [Planctomyces sp.]
MQQPPTPGRRGPGYHEQGGPSERGGVAHAAPTPDPRAMLAATGLSRNGSHEAAVAEACDRCLSELRRAAERVRGAGAPSIDAAVILVSGGLIPLAGDVAARAHAALQPRSMIGLSTARLGHGWDELVNAPAVCVLALSAPGVSVTTFGAGDLFEQGPGDAERPSDDRAGLGTSLADAMGLGPAQRLTLVLTSHDTDERALAARLSLAAHQAARLGPGGGPIIAASAPSLSDERTGVIVGPRLLRRGVAGLTLSGPIRADALIAQGCRPIGRVGVVTSVKGEAVLGISGEPALDVLHQAVAQLAGHERRLLASGVLLGVVADEYRERFGPGDYHLSALLGVDPASGALLVDPPPRVGQTVRLHVPDGLAAERDLQLLMDGQALHGEPAAALLLSGGLRGPELFGRPGVDNGAVLRAFSGGTPGESLARGGTHIAPREGFPLVGAGVGGLIAAPGGADHTTAQARVHKHSAAVLLLRRG